jgi:branched-subunit amino acid aminotransferase/4-amino-4-deoxychorismate lyase
MNTEWIDWNGKLVSTQEKILTAWNPAFYSGMSVYETLFVRNSKIAFYEEHYARFLVSMDFLGIQPQENFQEKLKLRIKELILRNQIQNGRIRCISFLNERNEFQSVLLFNHILQFPESISLYISKHKKPYPPFYPTNVKISANLFSYLSYQEAKSNGYDEGLMLDSQGNVTEGSYCNIFLKLGNRFYTPSTEVSLLEGVTRSKILQIAKSIGVEIREEKISHKILESVDSIYISSSSRGLLFVQKLNDRIFTPKEDYEYLQIESHYNVSLEESLQSW